MLVMLKNDCATANVFDEVVEPPREYICNDVVEVDVAVLDEYPVSVNVTGEFGIMILPLPTVEYTTTFTGEPVFPETTNELSGRLSAYGVRSYVSLLPICPA